MRNQDLTRVLVRNLRGAIVRNVLTTLGIGAGTASLAIMLSVAFTLQHLIEQQIGETGLGNVLYVSKLEGGERRNSSPPINTPDSVRLDDALIGRLRSLPQVEDVYPELRIPAMAESGTFHRKVALLGIRSTTNSIESTQLESGSQLSSAGASGVLVSKAFAGQLAAALQIKPAELIGREIVLRYFERRVVEPEPGAASVTEREGTRMVLNPAFVTVRIVGIIRKDTVAFLAGATPASIFLPIEEIQQRHMLQAVDTEATSPDSGGHSDLYKGFVVRTNDPGGLVPVEKQVTDLRLSASSLFTLIRGLKLLFVFIDVLLIFISSVAFVVASINIVNTLLMAILERRREIGIMKAIGATDGEISAIFVGEASILGLFGGILGTALGWTVSFLACAALNFYLRKEEATFSVTLTFPLLLPLALVCTAVLISVAASILPARRAGRLQPTDALRDRA